MNVPPQSFYAMATYPKTQKRFRQHAQVSLFNADVAEIQLTYSHKVKASHRPQIHASSDAERILRNAWPEGTMDYVEAFYILLLDRSNKVLGVVPISQGGVSGTVADPKVIFSAALLSNSSAIILAHNHPSGNLKPSEADIRLTRKMKESGQFLDLPVLDHIILTQESFYSFADEGII